MPNQTTKKLLKPQTQSFVSFDEPPLVTTRLLGLLQETNNTKVYPKRQGLIYKFPKFQSFNSQSSQSKFSIGVFSCSLPLLLLALQLSRTQEVPVLYSGGTRPPRWLITGTWKTEIQHSHTRMHSIYTRMHSIYTHSCRQNRQS